MTSSAFINKYIKTFSELRISSYCIDREFYASSIDDLAAARSAVGSGVFQIQLCDDCVRIVLRIYFQDKVAVRWASHGLQMPEKNVTESVAADYLREFLNFFAGYVRTAFDATKFKFSMQFLELRPHIAAEFEADAQSQDPAVLVWRLDDDADAIILSSRIQVLDQAVFDAKIVDLPQWMSKFLAAAVNAESMGGVVEKLSD